MTSIRELNEDMRQRAMQNTANTQNDILRDIKHVLIGIKESIDSLAKVLDKHEHS
jgi:hypothetical protein